MRRFAAERMFVRQGLTQKQTGFCLRRRTGENAVMLETRLAGNAPLKAAIAQMRAGGRMGHSLLLVGEPGLGAGHAARCIAADLLYPAGGPAAEALLRGQCCHAVAKSGDRDSGRIETGVVREAIAVRGGAKNGDYLVGQVMAARSECFNSSLSTEGRVILLYRVERMNEASANALLKVLEEPPENVTFLLTASSLAGVLPTIRSRCYDFTMAPVPLAECAAFCQKRGVSAEDARLLSAVFDGRIGTVLAVAQNKTRRARLETARALAQAAAQKDAYTAAVLLAAFEKDRPGADEVLEDLSALAAAALRDPSLCPLQGLRAVAAVRAADTARERLRRNGSAKLVLTMAAAQLAE